MQLQCRILSKGGHNEAEEQSDQHKHGRQDNLKHKQTPTSVKKGQIALHRKNIRKEKLIMYEKQTNKQNMLFLQVKILV